MRRNIREKASEWFKRLFEVMGQLEISKIGGALYSYWPVDFSKPVHKEDDWKYSVEGMKKLSELAKPYQITLNLEVLNRFENHILNTAEEGVQFVTEVDRDNVKVMLDTFHMNIEETSISAAIRTAGNLLGHFHTGECNRMVPGQGRMPWREIAEALHEIQYDGSGVMEPFVRRGGQIEKDIHISYLKMRDELNKLCLAVKVVGDVNNDGKLSIRDITIMQKYLAGSATLTSAQRFASGFDPLHNSITQITEFQKHINKSSTCSYIYDYVKGNIKDLADYYMVFYPDLEFFTPGFDGTESFNAMYSNTRYFNVCGPDAH